SATYAGSDVSPGDNDGYGRAAMRHLRSLLILAAALAIAAALPSAALAKKKHHHEREHEDSLTEFAHKHPKLRHRLPIAIVKEKAEEPGKEGKSEIVSGPSQGQGDERAFPRQYVDDGIAAAGRQDYLDAASTTALASPWSELGPFTPTVPKEVTYTGAPTTDS